VEDPAAALPYSNRHLDPLEGVNVDHGCVHYCASLKLRALPQLKQHPGSAKEENHADVLSYMNSINFYRFLEYTYGH